LNCRRSFQEGETLPPEGIHIEYKKYYLPIKDHQPKWILLKTIIAFLNSKGGTIFMGVDDSTR
jgi:predicted HTH transcriptional regulator